jgi:hypothetical protein
MLITVEIPDDLSQYADPAREALEAFAIAGYKSGALTPLQVRVMLGFDTRYDFDGFLKRHEVWEHAYGVDDLEQDLRGLAK